jgi:hypothetical protein
VKIIGKVTRVQGLLSKHCLCQMPEADFASAGKQSASIETNAQAVLDVRAKHPISMMADLYNPLLMSCFRGNGYWGDRLGPNYV